MARRKKRRDMEVFGLSFMDCICCGFGAIILLYVIIQGRHPIVIEEIVEDLSGLLEERENQLYEIRGETTILNRELKGIEEQLSENKEKLARLQGDLSSIRGEFAASKERENAIIRQRDELLAARQRLERELEASDTTEATVGGVPVDSEYIVFVIDTSGSMRMTWQYVIETIDQTLAAYPIVKGIQVLDADGQYLFSADQGRWIADSKSSRDRVLSGVSSWGSNSGSNPAPGIMKAINDLRDPEKKIGLYVFGDEFMGGSTDTLRTFINRVNPVNPQGDRPIRIHAMGFPVVLTSQSGIAFANSMRQIAQENGGSFVGLPGRGK